MKKRIIVLLVLIIAMATLFMTTSCQGSCNKEYTEYRAYIKVGEEWIDIPIKKSTHYSGALFKITLQDGSTIYVSSINCILYYGELPTS